MNRQNHITPNGFAKLKAEWEELKYNERPQVKNQVTVAAAEGDRSENADYIYGKMRMRDIDKRLRQLDKLLDGAIIVDQVNQDGSVKFGANVSLKDENDKIIIYQLVGFAEVDPMQRKITMESPIGKAIKNKRCGDIIDVNTPRGIRKLKIMEINY